jgi:hypothetical protein
MSVPVRTVVETPDSPMRAAWMLWTPIANAARAIARSKPCERPARASITTSTTRSSGTPKLVSTCRRVANDASTAPSENPSSDKRGPTGESSSLRPVNSPDTATASSTAFPVWFATNCWLRLRNPAPSTAPAIAVSTSAVHACA